MRRNSRTAEIKLELLKVKIPLELKKSKRRKAKAKYWFRYCNKHLTIKSYDVVQISLNEEKRCEICQSPCRHE